MTTPPNNEEIGAAGQYAEEVAHLRKTGDDLAFAAARVVTEYDGIHRLRLALSEWYKIRADEGGRALIHLTEKEG